MRATISLIVALAVLVQQRPSAATAAWLLLNPKSFKGDWVSLDQESGMVARLRVDGNIAVLVMTAGATGPEYVFHSTALAVEAGKVRGRMVTEPDGMEIVVAGTGRSDGLAGWLRLRLRIVGQEYPPWGERTVEFAKEWRGDIAEVLVRNDRRAKAMMEDAKKRHPAQLELRKSDRTPKVHSSAESGAARDGGTR